MNISVDITKLMCIIISVIAFICIQPYNDPKEPDMRKIVFIDGSEGTAGLQIRERLAGRNDIEMLLTDDAMRKDPAERAKCMNASDVAILCLPDAAAVNAIALCSNPDTRIIDCSTAHRVKTGWAYGLPELSSAHREAVRSSRLIANPGCYATGFCAAVYPLIKLGIITPDYPLTCAGLSGYSGGGKKMIAEYGASAGLYAAPRRYALDQAHKHLPEMTVICGLAFSPAFDPMVCNFYSGMAVTVQLHSRLMAKKLTPGELTEELCNFYEGKALISVRKAEPGAYLPADLLSGSDRLSLYVTGNADRITVCSIFDNLGKGAAGAAVQNMNLALGLPEYTSLR